MIVEQATGICRRLARCFTDHCDPGRIEHGVEQLLAQRRWRWCWATATPP